MTRLIWGLSLIYIITSITLLGFLWIQEEKSKNTYDSNLIKNYITIFESISNMNETRAQYVYDTQINTPDILNLFRDFYNKNDNEKDIIRKKLHTKLDPLYEIMKKYNFKQLHFHLKDNTSFLRMHKPNKYGDNLTDMRSTVAYVNKNHKKIVGFEEGTSTNGWRNVYPISIDGEHIGSVEVSFSIVDIMKEMKKHEVKHIEFIIDKNVVKKKVFDSEKSNYVPSPYEGYLYEKRILSILPIIDKFNTFGFEKKLVHVHKIDTNIVRFPIALINPISKKDIGYIILTVEDKLLTEKNKIFNLLASVILISIVFIIWFIIRRLKIEKTLKEQEIKLQKIAHEKEKEEKISEAKDSFLLLFSHELKTPLNAIINFSKYLIKKQDNLEKLPKSKIAKLLEGIEQSADLMLTNVMQILDYNKLKEEKLTFNLENIPIHNLIQNIIKKHEPLQNQYNIQVEYINECEEITICTDKKRLEQIISNILSNAIKFAHKKVLITLTCKENSWELSIEDDGDGIKNKEEIVEFFSQNDSKLLHNEKNGIGIGLNFVKLLCNRLQISCQIGDSKKLGGVSFNLYKVN